MDPFSIIIIIAVLFVVGFVGAYALGFTCDVLTEIFEVLAEIILQPEVLIGIIIIAIIVIVLTG